MRTLFTTPSSSTIQFWGNTSSWDILYPGHCDDLPSPLYLSHPHTLYSNPTTLSHHLLHPDTHSFLASLNTPSNTRIIHRALFPFCTFAYAVTRLSATRILQNLARKKEGGISAFDVQLLEACRDGWGCWSTGAEVYHHAVGSSQISISDGGEADGGGGVVAEGQRIEVPGRATWNIACGARHRDVWVDEEDGEGRKRVKDLVGGMVGKVECPVDGLEEEKG